MIEVFAINIKQLNTLQDKELLDKIPAERLAHIKRLKRNSDYLRSLAGELLSRKALSDRTGIPSKDLRILYNPKGKPALADFHGLYFNNSHSGDWAVCALSSSETGLDIERVRKINFNIASRYFTEVENNYLLNLDLAEKTKKFFEIWTAKESYLKFLGTGLTRSLKSFEIRYLRNGSLAAAIPGKESPLAYIRLPEEINGYKTALCSAQHQESSGFHFMEIKDILANE